MSEALPIPPRPNLEHYKKLAKDFHRAANQGDAAVFEWAAHWSETHAQWLRQVWRRRPKAEQPLTLTGAQHVLARGHGFASWPKFVRHLRSLTVDGSADAQFEAAADAIVTGDIGRLGALLQENPALVRARSNREHRSTLLHYVSANGVEDFRQKSPKNIVVLTDLLLRAGADVNAESDAYGGRSTALNLTATSCHPEAAGVQIPLLELLLERGAAIYSGDVVSCLANGRGAAAEFLAEHGATLDLEGAAGVGRIEVVKTLFAEERAAQALAWACEFGRAEVVEFLLQQGVDVRAACRPHGQTALHWAAYSGQAAIVGTLLASGAPVNATDESFGGTPLDWALHAWGEGRANEPYYDVAALLARAGAKLPAVEKLRGDLRMQAALNFSPAGE